MALKDKLGVECAFSGRKHGKHVLVYAVLQAFAAYCVCNYSMMVITGLLNCLKIFTALSPLT
jgi:hypothetical protein